MKIIRLTIHATLLFALALWCNMATALERSFPANSVQVKIEAFNEPYLIASGKRYLLPPGALIFSTSNMSIVRGALPVGVVARIQLDLNGDLRRIWLLNPEEVVTGTSSSPTEKLQ